ncbi:metal-dependent transcriptional regulator [bacterium]|nr:metal-dependent transcriptional regulator [bacterium]
MKNKKELTANFEKYLCAIYNLEKANKYARVKDIAQVLNIGVSSVSESVKALSKKECLEYEPYGHINLTQKGIKIVKEKLKRSEIISNFLKNVLLVKEDLIKENAQRLEYGMDEEVLERFIRFITFMQKCSCKEPKWIKSFKDFAQNGGFSKKCNDCIKNCNQNSCKIDNSSCCGTKISTK